VENHKVKGIFTVNQGEVELTATHFVLATGSFFSHGLVTEDDEVKEPIFGVDVLQKAQTGFGVKTDAQFHPMIDGQCIKNLYAIGSVLPGFDPMREGCSSGVALLTAFAVSNRIINQTVES
jgi:glycerol-3-phosphate dehydrogenase subunit B